METVRFTSRSDSDPYRCNKPNDQSGEYYRKAEVDAELERLRAVLRGFASAVATVNDCIDNDGKPYQSAWLDAHVKAAIDAARGE